MGKYYDFDFTHSNQHFTIILGKGEIKMRIYYDSKTDTFIRVKQRGKKEAFDAVYLDTEVDKSLHDFFTNLANILRDEEPSIVLGEYEVTVRRKRITGECLGAVVPYTTCLIFRDSPHKFVDIYV